MNVVGVMCFFVVYCLSFGTCYGVFYDGVHQEADYVELAKDPAFDSSCLVSFSDGTHTIHQTGVLIRDDIVVTAAHGIISILKAQGLKVTDSIVKIHRVFVTFQTQKWKIHCACDAAFVDERYLMRNLGNESKYDIALLRLKEGVKTICPATIPKTLDLQKNDLLTVASFGDSDQYGARFAPFKRAFHLFETDIFIPGTVDIKEHLGVERTILLSSIFFKIQDMPPNQSDEAAVRSFEATKNWRHHGMKPFALALPGTSGAPVFVKRGAAYELIGLLTAYAPLSGYELALDTLEYILAHKAHPEVIQGRYQSIFVLFFKNYKKDPFAKDSTYRHDTEFMEAIRLLEEFPKDPPTWMEHFEEELGPYIKEKLENISRDLVAFIKEKTPKLWLFIKERAWAFLTS